MKVVQEKDLPIKKRHHSRESVSYEMTGMRLYHTCKPTPLCIEKVEIGVIR